MWLNLLLVVALVALDQLVKAAIVAHFTLGAVQVVIPGVLALTNLHNSGAAWSILSGQQALFFALTIVAVAVLGYFLWRYRQQRWLTLAFSLMLAGALGNFIDRLAQGYVVDMFELLFINFPVFNVADSCLTIGVALLALQILLEKDDPDDD